MGSNEREAKLKASSRQRATQGQIDDAYQPIRARTLLKLYPNIKFIKFQSVPKFRSVPVPSFSFSQKWVRFGMCGMPTKKVARFGMHLFAEPRRACNKHQMYKPADITLQ